MSDNELDAELLGMVGGESDDEGDEEVMDQTQHHVQDRSPSQEAKPSVEKIEEPSKRTKGVAQKVKGRRKPRRKQESEDDEIGGGSPTPPDSLDGGMDDELDAPGSPASPIEVANEYPIEGKFKSIAERDRILALPELQREVQLAERQQLLTRQMQDAALAAQTKQAKNKRKATAADLEDTGSGRTTRPKPEKTEDTAIAKYRRAREMKDAGRGHVDAGKGRDKRDDRSVSRDGSDDRKDADGESEVEWAEPSNSRGNRDEPPAELKDFERCRVGRSGFAKVCFYPGVEDALQGCFARISIGPDRATGQNLYRMTQIKGTVFPSILRFTEGKPYTMTASNGKTFTTDQYALVALGASEKSWPFHACSDSKFTDQEYSRYLSTLQKDHIRVPTTKYLAARVAAINGLLNIQWTDDLLSKKFANARAMERKHDPVHIMRVKRDALREKCDKAEDAGDLDEVAKLETELEELSASATHHISPPNPQKKKAPTAQDRLAALNARNRGKNAEEVRKALLEEKRRLNAAREAAVAAKKREEEAAAAAEAKKMLAVPSDMKDLFGEGSDASRSGTPVPGTRRARSGTPSGVTRKLGGLGVGGRKKMMDDEVIGSMDLGIDIEI